MSVINNYISEFSSYIARNGHSYYGHLSEGELPFEKLEIYDKNKESKHHHLGKYGWTEFLEPRTNAHHLAWGTDLVDLSNEMSGDTIDPGFGLSLDTTNSEDLETLWIQNLDNDVIPYSSEDTIEIDYDAYSRHAWIRLR